MMRSLYSAISGLKNEQIAMDVIGNNIANVNTTGYKYSRTGFTTMLSQTLRGASSPDGDATTPSTYGGTNGIQIGLGAQIASTDQIMTQGSSQITGKNTDLMIQGEGFFCLHDAQSNLYFTRNGNFTTDSLGNLVDASTGYMLYGYANTTYPAPSAWPTDPTTETQVPINLQIGMDDPTSHSTTNTLSSFSIDSSGTITGTFSDPTGANAAYSIALYKLPIATCNNPAGLTPVGNTYYQESPNSGTITYGLTGQNGNKAITPGALEMSNVDLSQQFTDMIVTQRGFQANSRVITVSDTLLQELVDLKRQ